MGDSATSSSPLPLIDFSSFIAPDASPSARLAVARELVSACHTVGFAYIKNHGLSAKLLEHVFLSSEKFFDLPQNEKMQIGVAEGAVRKFGYSYPGKERASRLGYTKKREGEEEPEDIMATNEKYVIGSDNHPDGSNLWLPESAIPGFRGLAGTVFEELWKIASEVLRAIALGLGLEHEDELLKHHSKNGPRLAFRHYPPLDVAEAKRLNVQRLSAHRDFTPSITMLFQDECGGLEVQKPGDDGEFTPVQPIEGTFVLNIGDVLMRWSNDYLVSTLHRVELPPRQDDATGDPSKTRNRYSLPFFVEPEPDTIVECLRECCDEANPARYQPISHKDYIQRRIEEITGTVRK